jgi:hypothetical protein
MLLRIKGKIDKRLKQLVKEHGEIWRMLKYSPGIYQSGPSWYIESMDGTHQRWIDTENAEEIENVG